MKNKGFTLIELLAVIIILAVIVAIAVPAVLNIVDKSKSKSSEASKNLYLRAVEQAIVTKNVKEEFNPTLCEVNEDGKLICTEGEEKEELLVEVSGTKPCKGSITIRNKKVASETLDFCDGKLPQDEPIPDVPKSKSFQEDSWETIVANVQAETGAYKVGDTKEVTLKGTINGTFILRVANITSPKEEGCGGEEFSETACGFVVEFTDIITLSDDLGKSGGWEKNVMRTYLNGEVLVALPQELQDEIIETKVVSGHEKGVSTNYTTTDKLYLLSPHEVFSKGEGSSIDQTDSAWGNTRQLDYYKQEGVTTSNYRGAIKKYNGADTGWWLRAPASLGSFTMQPDGLWSITPNPTAEGYGVSPAFRIG